MKRAMRVSPAIAAALLSLPALSSAQNIQQLKERADSLVVVYEQSERAWRAARAADSLRVLGTIAVGSHERLLTVGGIRIVVDTSLTGVAERAAGQALQQVHQMFGSATTASVSSEVWGLNVVPKDQGDTTNGKREISFRFHKLGAIGLEEGGRTKLRAAREVSILFRRRLDDVMLQSMDEKATEWAGRLLGAGEPSKNFHEYVFRELAIGPHPLAPRCFRYDLAACRSALALNADYTLGQALSSSSRASLLRLALEKGGSESFARFMSDTTQSMEERLTRAAGAPIDTLIALWLKRSHEAQPQPASTSLPTVLAALCWCSLMCAISLRSTRWR